MALDSGIPAGMTELLRWLKNLYNQVVFCTVVHHFGDFADDSQLDISCENFCAFRAFRAFCAFCGRNDFSKLKQPGKNSYTIQQNS